MLSIYKPKSVKTNKNCLTCKYFITCEYPHKSHKYRCIKWKKSNYAVAEKATQLVQNADKKLIKIEKQLQTSDSEKSFNEALSSLIKSESAVAPDVRVDDSDFKLANNFFEFCYDKNYLGIRPWAKQIQAGIHLFGDACPRCSDKDWYRSIPFKASISKIKRKICFLEHGICPECKKDRLYFLQKGMIKDYFEFAALAGQRSGKSHLLCMLSTYLLHQYIKIQNPAAYFNQLPNTLFIGTFVALTFNSAKELLFTPLYNMISDSKWYQDYFEMLKHSENKLGVELYKFKDTFISFRHRNLLLYPAGPDKRSLRGRTRFVGAIDEIGWFDSSNPNLVKLSASEIHHAMGRSFQTLRSESRLLRENGLINVPKPLFLNIGSPSSRLDMITKLYRRSKKSKIIYGFKYPTWRMNPRITKEDLSEYFEDDPIAAMRDYGCEPSLTAAPFINDVEDIAGSFRKSYTNAAHIKPNIVHAKRTRKRMVSGKILWNWRDDKIPKLMTLDTGHTSNSFAIVVGHNERNKDGDVFPVYDLLSEIIPQTKSPISFTQVYRDVIIPIALELNVSMIYSDRWQNIKLLQDAEDQINITSEQYSVRYDDFINFKSNIREGNITFPRPNIKLKNISKINLDTYPWCFTEDPVAHFIFQCLTVEDIPGKTVKKGQETTDDIFRAVVLAHVALCDSELAPLFLGEGQERRGGGGIIAIGDQDTINTSNPNMINNIAAMGDAEAVEFDSGQFRPLSTM